MKYSRRRSPWRGAGAGAGGAGEGHVIGVVAGEDAVVDVGGGVVGVAWLEGVGGEAGAAGHGGLFVVGVDGLGGSGAEGVRVGEGVVGRFRGQDGLWVVGKKQGRQKSDGQQAESEQRSPTHRRRRDEWGTQRLGPEEKGCFTGWGPSGNWREAAGVDVRARLRLVCPGGRASARRVWGRLVWGRRRWRR